MKNNFSRSNVNESTLQVTDPMRSSFDLSHRNNLTLKLGRLTPVNLERLIGTDVIQGSLTPQFQLEVAGTPTIGKLRLDTHTFQVNMRRIHNGFRQFVENTTNNDTLPSFLITQQAATYIRLLSSSVTSDSDYAADDLSAFFGLGTTDKPTSTDTTAQIAAKIKSKFVGAFRNWSSPNAGDLGFMRDFLAIEHSRLSAIQIPNDDSAIAYVIYEILQPLFGEGSLLDFLGYPIYRRDSAWYQALSDPKVTSNWFKGTLADVDLINVFKLYHWDTLNNPEYLTDESYSEMPLRAAYAVYYDYFRDWHIEPRTKVLDPDTFGYSPLLPFLVSFDHASTRQSALSRILQLLVLRYRNYARDFLTTVQTDDIYRHVYAPVFADHSDEMSESSGSINAPIGYNVNKLHGASGLLNNDLSQLTNIVAGLGENVPFLSDMFYSFQSSSSMPMTTGSFSLYSDLQTMRRTGMLEKWLARNYFFPDTYVGQLRARYGVVPEDVNVLISQYLGGTESFVTGEQVKAPVDTPQMAAGSRTIVSGVNGKDSFTYQASDHCYIISFVSLMPLVNYDLKNMHTKELRVMDIPAPEFAQDSRVAIRTKDMLRGFDYQNDVLGYVPRYYHYRVHGDETHGRYLSDLRTYAWFRDWFNMNFSNDPYTSGFNAHGFALTPYALRVHLSPDAFNGLAMWDDIAYGSCDVEFFANRPLPAAVDII